MVLTLLHLHPVIFLYHYHHVFSYPHGSNSWYFSFLVLSIPSVDIPHMFAFYVLNLLSYCRFYFLLSDYNARTNIVNFSDHQFPLCSVVKYGQYQHLLFWAFFRNVHMYTNHNLKYWYLSLFVLIFYNLSPCFLSSSFLLKSGIIFDLLLFLFFL